jgi:hypothetical protein
MVRKDPQLILPVIKIEHYGGKQVAIVDGKIAAWGRTSFKGRVLDEMQRLRAKAGLGKTGLQPGILGYCHTLQQSGGSRCLAREQSTNGPKSSPLTCPI